MGERTQISNTKPNQTQDININYIATHQSNSLRKRVSITSNNSIETNENKKKHYPPPHQIQTDPNFPPKTKEHFLENQRTDRTNINDLSHLATILAINSS